MDMLLATATALAVSLALIPLMIRFAPTLGMLDQPAARKIHLQPVPRVGGWGITLGAIVAILLWLPGSPVTTSFLLGALALLVAGAWDDRGDLRAGIKLLIQLGVALPLLLHAGLTMEGIPLAGEYALPFAISLPLTVLGLVGCINATNTSDGLDGLAAGITLLSLAGILVLGYLQGSTEVMLLAAAAIGALAGFLRYNTHPATIFMGDAGSQYLGFAVGFLGLVLVHAEPGEFSPWLLLLLVGLPPVDLCVVAVRRLFRGTHPFRPDKSHIHHRLLELGFTHSQAVVSIYTIQASFVFFGVALEPSQAWKILLVYGLHLALIYGFVHLAEQTVTSRRRAQVARQARLDARRPTRPLLVWAPRVALEMTLPLALVSLAVLAVRVPREFGLLAGALLLPLALKLFRIGAPPSVLIRVPVFMLIAASAYLYTESRPFTSNVAFVTEIAGMSWIAALSLASVWYSPGRRQREFRTSALDYLLLILAGFAFIGVQAGPLQINPWFVLYTPILLYASELLLVERRDRRDWLFLSVMLVACVLLSRGLLS